MDKVSGQEILDLWKTTQQSTGVYIHSAFCKEQCTYCTFKGMIFNKHEWKKYYEEYLPKMIEFYGDILSSPQIDGYFFGGGTPSLMSPSEMRNLFDLIPNFKSQKNKVMEIHVCDWNKEQLDVLKEYNFNIVIVCVQTFDRDALKKYKRRVPKSTDVVCEHIRYANSIGIKTNSDILYLDTGNTAKDINRLMVDMQLLADNEISEITIQTLYDEEGKFDNIVTATTELFLNKNPEYAMYNTFVPMGEEVDIPIVYKTKSSMRCVTLRMIRRDVDPIEIFHWLPMLDEMVKWPADVSTRLSNTLGIGSYSNYKDTFSTIEDRIEYKEIGNLNYPEFYITYNKLDYNMKDLIASFYEELDNLIGGEAPDGVVFNFSTVVDTMNFVGPKEDRKNLKESKVLYAPKRISRELVIGMFFPERGDNYVQSAYRKKLETIWPTISKHWKFANRPI